MARRPQRLFLEDKSYRRRRIMDAARLLPFAGSVLFLLPVLRDPANTPEKETAGGMVYLFVIWFILIVLAMWLSASLRKSTDEEAQTDESGG